MDRDLRKIEGDVVRNDVPFSRHVVADALTVVAPYVARGFIVLKADVGNTGDILIGPGALVALTHGVLEPGGTLYLRLSNISLINALNNEQGDKLYVFGAYKT